MVQWFFTVLRGHDH